MTNGPEFNNEKARWPHDPWDTGVGGENHDWYSDGSGHHTLWRHDGSHMSWDADPDGYVTGNWHIGWPNGDISNLGNP